MFTTHPSPKDRIGALGQPLAWTADTQGLDVRTKRYAAAFQR